MEKLYNKQGQVAVAISYDYGAGWSTWNDVSPLDKRYNELILAHRIEEAIELAESEGHYAGGLKNCEIEWLPKNAKFRISEYDGSESLIEYSPEGYLTA